MLQNRTEFNWDNLFILESRRLTSLLSNCHITVPSFNAETIQSDPWNVLGNLTIWQFGFWTMVS